MEIINLSDLGDERPTVVLDEEGHMISPKPPKLSGHPSLSDDEAYGQRKCEACSAPNCNLWCSGCDITEVGKIRTFYCSRECQVKHRPEHKKDCTARLRVARATSILYPLYLAFAKVTSITTTEIVSEKDGVITIGHREHDLRPYVGDSIFVHPGTPIDIPKNLEEAVLLHEGCDEVVPMANHLLAHFMQPFVKSFELARAKPKNLARVVRVYNFPSMHDSSPHNRSHSVLKITAGDSEVYALDLTGAQYGWKDLLYKWDTYAECRFEQNVKSRTILEQVCHSENFANEFAIGSSDGAQYILRRRVMNRFMYWLQYWLDHDARGKDPDGAVAIKSVVHAKTHAEFTARKQKLLEQALKIPQTCIRELEGLGTMYLSGILMEEAALTHSELSWYSHVWLNKDDPRLLSLSRKELEAVWLERLYKYRNHCNAFEKEN